jgi:hypothetical protein
MLRSMAIDSTAPATKDDIKILMDEIGKSYQASERWKNELSQKMEAKMEAWKEEIKGHFDLVAEQLRSDIVSATREEVVGLKDATQGYQKRLRRVEQALGISPS